MREWTAVSGSTVQAEVVAFDTIHVTLKQADGRKLTVPAASLSELDRKWLLEWRKENPDAPWIDPESMPVWPEVAGTGPVTVKVISSDPEKSEFIWRSQHYEFQSDIKIPLSALSHIATICEATRDAVLRLPLGLRAVPKNSWTRRAERSRMIRRFDLDHMRVKLYRSPETYARGGGVTGSGGYYSSGNGHMAISLENYGIKSSDNGGLKLDYMKNAFVIKHEATHQIMHHWLPVIPMWLREGFAEYIAAAPYSQGRYTFRRMDDHLHRHLNRWRQGKDPNQILLLPLEKLMKGSEKEWVDEMRQTTPVVRYNSAAIVTHFFLHYDGKGSGKHFTATLNAVRNGTPFSKAAEEHLLRGRSNAVLFREIADNWKRRQVELVKVGLQ